MIWIQSVLGEDFLVCREDGAEGLSIDVGILFGVSDNLIEYDNIYRALSVAINLVLSIKTYFRL